MSKIPGLLKTLVKTIKSHPTPSKGVSVSAVRANPTAIPQTIHPTSFVADRRDLPLGDRANSAFGLDQSKLKLSETLMKALTKEGTFAFSHDYNPSAKSEPLTKESIDPDALNRLMVDINHHLVQHEIKTGAIDEWDDEAAEDLEWDDSFDTSADDGSVDNDMHADDLEWDGTFDPSIEEGNTNSAENADDAKRLSLAEELMEVLNNSRSTQADDLTQENDVEWTDDWDDDEWDDFDDDDDVASVVNKPDELSKSQAPTFNEQLKIALEKRAKSINPDDEEEEDVNAEVAGGLGQKSIDENLDDLVKEGEEEALLNNYDSLVSSGMMRGESLPQVPPPVEPKGQYVRSMKLKFDPNKGEKWPLVGTKPPRFSDESDA